MRGGDAMEKRYDEDRRVTMQLAETVRAATEEWDRGKTEWQKIIERVPQGDRQMVSIDAQRDLNMRGGRPSDAARSVVRYYQQVGPIRFREEFEEARRDGSVR